MFYLYFCASYFLYTPWSVLGSRILKWVWVIEETAFQTNLSLLPCRRLLDMATASTISPWYQVRHHSSWQPPRMKQSGVNLYLFLFWYKVACFIFCVKVCIFMCMHIAMTIHIRQASAKHLWWPILFKLWAVAECDKASAGKSFGSYFKEKYPPASPSQSHGVTAAFSICSSNIFFVWNGGEYGGCKYVWTCVCIAWIYVGVYQSAKWIKFGACWSSPA